MNNKKTFPAFRKIPVAMAVLVALTELLSAQTNAPAKPDPNFIASPADLKARLDWRKR